MSVEQTWTELVAWCRKHAPRTAHAMQAPADAAAISAAERNFSRPWSDDLLAWFCVQNGVADDAFDLDGLLFQFVPLSLDEAVEEARERAEFTEGGTEDTAAENDEAGTPGPWWLPSLVPIARHVNTDVLCVDLRPGQRSGCLVEYGEDGLGAGQSSLAELLQQVLIAVQTGESHEDLRASVVDGELQWDFILASDQ